MDFAVKEPCLSRDVGKGCQGKGNESIACDRIVNLLVPIVLATQEPKMPCACFVPGDGSSVMETTAQPSGSQLEAVSSQPCASQSSASFTLLLLLFICVNPSRVDLL